MVHDLKRDLKPERKGRLSWFLAVAQTEVSRGSAALPSKRLRSNPRLLSVDNSFQYGDVSFRRLLPRELLNNVPSPVAA